MRHIMRYSFEPDDLFACQDEVVTEKKDYGQSNSTCQLQKLHAVWIRLARLWMLSN